jgi:hypothetical protein
LSFRRKEIQILNSFPSDTKFHDEMETILVTP